MNLQFVKYFVLLAETGNFTQAAERAHVVQSTFSIGIKKLEEQLHCKLFHRTNRQVSLTHEGEVLLPKAKALLGQWNTMELMFADPEAQTLRLGLTQTVDAQALVYQLKEVHSLYPTCEVQIHEDSEESLSKKLKQGQINAYFTEQLPAPKAGLCSKVIREDPLEFALPSSHPFVHSKKIPLKALHGVDFIERCHCNLVREIHGIMEKEKIKPHVVFRAKSDETTRALVASGLGVALLPSSSLSQEGVVLRPVRGEQFIRKIYIVWREKDEVKALQAILKS